MIPECKYKICRRIDSPGLPAMNLSVLISIAKCFFRHILSIPRISEPSKQSREGLITRNVQEGKKISLSSVAAENFMVVSRQSGGCTF